MQDCLSVHWWRYFCEEWLVSWIDDRFSGWRIFWFSRRSFENGIPHANSVDFLVESDASIGNRFSI